MTMEGQTMIDAARLNGSFERIGARVKLTFREPSRFGSPNVRIDVRRDKRGEFFDLNCAGDINLLVLDCDPADRHLLLMARLPDNPKAKFLCGHDERHWFTAAIPENSGARTVMGAKQALKPKELVELESVAGVRTKDLHKHRRRMKSGGKIIRQGEFMFVPMPGFAPDTDAVLEDEELSRGGHPHIAQYLYRKGGIRVYVSLEFPNGLTVSEYEARMRRHPEERKKDWRMQVRDPIAYVKGKIRHPDHATVDLGGTWHRVMVSTESMAKARKVVAFID
jgi:hypothetical protein